MTNILQKHYRGCIADQSVALVEQSAEIESLKLENEALRKKLAELDNPAETRAES